jgi:VIT1/CCC1 family predicted Fe2+/Mn2+ transporter
MDRISEVLFGVIMVLTFTGALSVATADRLEVREVLVGALGCNLAWGVIDAGLYLMGRLQERGRTIQTFRAVRDTTDEVAARRIVAETLPAVLVTALPSSQLEVMRQAVLNMPEPPLPRLTMADIGGAVAVFLLVFLVTLPLVVPFLFIGETRLALRVSNGVAVALLFLSGYAFGKRAGLHPWVSGLAMVVVGILLVGLTIALGG